jgi:manganese/zinc/iron transport system permease protein
MNALLSSPLVQTVLLGAGLIGAVSGALGVFAVLRRQSLLGDTISHAALPGICLGYLVAGGRDLGALLAGAFVTGALAALVLHQITTRTRLKQDAALGLVLSLFFALGVVLLTYAQGRGGSGALALQGFLFGQASAITRADVALMAIVAALVALGLGLFWRQVKLATFDPQGATLQGFPRSVIDAGLTLAIALAVVLGLQLVGVVLMVALLIAPAVAARQWVGSLGGMVVLAALLGAGAGMGGALVSATARGLSTGPVVVLITVALVGLSLAFAPQRGVVAQILRTRKARRNLADAQVLGTLQALSKAHADPAYPIERGMLRAALGPGSTARLKEMEARGLVRAVPHDPETTPHWELTQAGHDAAQGGKNG